MFLVVDEQNKKAMENAARLSKCNGCKEIKPKDLPDHLTMEELLPIATAYKIRGTGEYLMENYNMSKDEALHIATIVHEEMDKAGIANEETELFVKGILREHGWL